MVNERFNLEDTHLVTLSPYACHKGLDLHFEMSLAGVFPESDQRFNESIADLDSFAKDFFEGVKQIA